MNQQPSKKRVLFVGAFPPPNRTVTGGNIADCEALLRSSFGKSLDLVLMDSTQQTLPAPPVTTRAFFALKRAKTFFSELLRRRPDAVLLFASGGMSFLEKSAYCAVAKAFGVPSLLSVRSGHFIDQCRKSPSFRGLAAELLKVPRFVLAQGEVWRQFLNGELGVPPDRAVVVENWVATPELLSIAATRNYARELPNIVFIGWMERFKGIYDLAEALANLERGGCRVPFRATFVGGGGELEVFQEFIRARGLSHIVSAVGMVSPDSIPSVLERADIFVLPSHTEGLPNAMIEAMAAGLPVVVTPVGSVPDVITDGSDGMLVPPRDPESLSKALDLLIQDSALRRRLGAAASSKAAARFTAERAASQILALISKAAGEKTKSRLAI